MFYIIFTMIKPVSGPLCCVDGGGVILEETTLIRNEILVFVLIYNDSSLYRDMYKQALPEKVLWQH